jgi:hypothetical protein
MKSMKHSGRFLIHDLPPSWEEVEKVLAFFSRVAHWPRPVSMSLLDGEEEETVPVSTWDDAQFRRAYERLRLSSLPLQINLENEYDALIIHLDEHGIYWLCALPEEMAMKALAGVFSDFCLAFKPQWGYFLAGGGREEELRNRHFGRRQVVPYSGILSWLHYFNAAALDVYGLHHLLKNPFVKVTALGEGHVFQVLDDPSEINTPAGEALVISANQWMLENRP